MVCILLQENEPMLKNVNNKRTVLQDLETTEPAVIDEDILRLVAGGRPMVGGPTCTLNDDSDGMTCTLFNDED
jgi:hypothetical protein